MESAFFDIDPSGDTLLILHNANAPFAVLPSSTPQEQQKESNSTPDDKSEKDWQDTDSELEGEEGKPGDENSESKDAKDKPTIRMRLSSKHLTLASAYFQKLTANSWKETTPKNGYSYTINAYDWDVKALLVLMNIIHGRTAKVPRSFTLEMLAKIAVLVDYYQCHEAVEFFAQTWLAAGTINIPEEGERDFMLRLVVCLVFSENFNFWLLTKVIIQRSKGPIDSLGLPIGKSLLDDLNKKRVDSIFDVLNEVGIVKRMLYEEKKCTFECSSINLGALIKTMGQIRAMDPYPKRPYPGLSLMTLEQGLRAIKEPSWNTNCRGISLSQAASTKSAPAQTTGSNIFGGTTSSTQNSPAQAVTNPAPAGGLFGNGSMPQAHTPAKFGFGSPPAPRATSPLPTTKPAAPLFTTAPNPNCTLSVRIKPVIDGLVKKLDGLQLMDYVKRE